MTQPLPPEAQAAKRLVRAARDEAMALFPTGDAPLIAGAAVALLLRTLGASIVMAAGQTSEPEKAVDGLYRQAMLDLEEQRRLVSGFSFEMGEQPPR